jgi:hypothetical protein
VAVIAVAFALAAPVSAQQAAPVSISNTDIGGVVTGPRGPEAHVWVIAETTDLPAHMIKIVVTDEQDATSFLNCLKQITWCGGAAMVSSTPPRPRPNSARS